MKPRYIDSHAHLSPLDYKEDLQAVLDRARDAGVEAVIVPATDLESSREAIQLADRHSEIFACVGFHPHEASKATENGLQEIEELSKHPKVVAIGEIGLDYYYNLSPHDRQCEVFESQIEIAVRRNLPLVVHMRESTIDTFAAVERAVQKNYGWLPDASVPKRGVFHCFPGTVEESAKLRNLGFWVSFTGIVTFKKSQAADIVKQIGFQNVLLETDSPYMTPEPFRGKRNEPAHIVYIGKKIAEVSGVSEEEVAASTTANAKALFGLRMQKVPRGKN